MKRIFSLMLAVVFLFTAVFSAAEEGAELTASEQWQAFDHDFLYYFLKEDVSSTNQLFKNEDSFPIAAEDVVITLGSYSKSEYERYYADMHVFYERLMAIDRTALTAEEQYAYDAVREVIELDLEGEEFYGYFEPLTYLGIQSDLALVFWLYDIATLEDAETYLALLATVPEFMADLLAYEQYRVELGIFMPENALDTVLSDCDDIINTGNKIFLVSSFETAVDAIPGLSKTKRAELKKQNKELLQSAFIGGYKTLRDGLALLRPYCREAVGIAELGNETYSRYYEYYLKVTCSDTASMESISGLLYEYVMSDWEATSEAYTAAGEFFEGTMSIGTVEENMEYLYELCRETLPEAPETEITYYNVPKSVQDVFPPAAYLVAAFDDPSHVTIILNQPEKDEELLRTLAHEGWYGHLYQYASVRGGCSYSQQFVQGTAYSEAFSHLGEYFFTEETDKFNSDALQTDLYADWMQNSLITYCGILVNGYGYTETQLKKFLKESFGYDYATGKAIYEVAVEMPFYYMPYAYGICRIRDIYKNVGYSDWKTFYEDCFTVGPAYFNLLEASCRELRGLPAKAQTDLPEIDFGDEQATAA